MIGKVKNTKMFIWEAYGAKWHRALFPQNFIKNSSACPRSDFVPPIARFIRHSSRAVVAALMGLLSS